MEWLGLAVVASSVIGVVGGLIGYVVVRRRHEERNEQALRRAQELELDIPPTLHPVIDPDVCIGSLACVSACPEGDVLGLVGGRAALVAGSECIGHGRCAAECPVGAISLVFGTAKRGVDLPELDQFFETSRPGVHIIGELGGMGLIKNAVTQGRQCIEELAKRCTAGSGDLSRFDVVIVGAGPAGLSAAVSCRAAGLRHCVLEQDTLGGTIAQYPRQKVVMTERVELPLYGRFGKKRISKEELLDAWADVLAETGVEVRERVRVTGIEGEDGAFTVKTSSGEVRGRKVVLALGRRGTPRKLGAPGEDLPKVTYRLIDPEQYEGKRVLVVGGGDSALEAAIMLAQESSAEVSISYRNPAFGRCRPENKQRIEALMEGGRVHALMGTTVTRVEPERVFLSEGGGPARALDNDYVIVCIGGVLPTELLQQAGIAIDRHFGEAPLKKRRRDNIGAKAAPRKSAAAQPERPRSRLGLVLAALGALLVAGLAAHGWDYYGLPRRARLDSPLHEMLKPAGTWGHGIGVAATAVMLMNFLYALRKRTRVFGRLGSVRTWLAFHVFVGIMSPIVIAFHAAFQSNNLLATATAGALAVVVGTGLFGRYLFGMVPTVNGRIMSLDDVKLHWEALISQLDASTCAANERAALKQLSLDVKELPSPSASLVGMILTTPIHMVRARVRARSAHHLFDRREDYALFRSAYLAIGRARLQLAFYPRLKRVLTVWRAFHVVLSVFLVFVMAAHIALSLYLGYGWLLF